MTEYARDDFARTVSGSWGTADLGGAWSQDISAGVTAAVGTPYGQMQLATAASRGDQRLAAGTLARDVAAAIQPRIQAGWGTADISWSIWLRASGALASPVGYFARLTFRTNLTLLVEIGYAITPGTEVILKSQGFGAWANTAGHLWVFEFQAFGSPTQLWARAYRPAAGVPAGNAAWIGANDEVGPQVAGAYQVRAVRPAAAATVQVWLEYLYATDVPIADPQVTSSTGLTVNMSGSTSTGDITAYSWDWGDGSGATAGVNPSHTYAATGTYRVTLTITTRWGSKFSSATYVPVSTTTLPVAILPVVRIAGVDVCDYLASISWSLGRNTWTDSLAGLTCSVRLRGIYSCFQGQALTVAVPGVAGGAALWSGVIDTVTESYDPFSARNETTVLGMDTASALARRHLPYGVTLPLKKLPARLADLKNLSATSLAFRYRYSVPVDSFRWLDLKRKTQAADELRDRTYLQLITDAMLASFAFSYAAGDGVIAYAPMEAPPSLPSTPRLDLNTGPDCAARISLDRNAMEGILNRWTVGDGARIDFDQKDSVDKYGEHAYTVPAATLDDDGFFYTAFARWDGLRLAFQEPVRAAEAEVPVIDWAQKVITAQPLDFATWNAKVYSIVGVRHEVDPTSWRVTLSLDRNPWEMDGRTVP